MGGGGGGEVFVLVVVLLLCSVNPGTVIASLGNRELIALLLISLQCLCCLS